MWLLQGTERAKEAAARALPTNAIKTSRSRANTFDGCC